MRLDFGCRLDLLLEGRLIVKLKSTESVQPVHRAQLLTYMRLADVSTGSLISFNVPLLKDGVERFLL